MPLPWFGWTFLIRLMTMGWSGSRFIADSTLQARFDMLFQLHEAGTLGGVQHLAAELDRQRRGITVQAGQQRHLHAFEHLVRLGDALLDLARQRPDEAVGEQDAEEGADQRMADQLRSEERRVGNEWRRGGCAT